MNNTINATIALLLERFKLSSPKLYAIIATVIITINTLIASLISTDLWDPATFWQGIIFVLSQIVLALPSTSTKRHIDPVVAEKIDRAISDHVIETLNNEC